MLQQPLICSAKCLLGISVYKQPFIQMFLPATETKNPFVSRANDQKVTSAIIVFMVLNYASHGKSAGASRTLHIS